MGFDIEANRKRIGYHRDELDKSYLERNSAMIEMRRSGTPRKVISERFNLNLTSVGLIVGGEYFKSDYTLKKFAQNHEILFGTI